VLIAFVQYVTGAAGRVAGSWRVRPGPPDRADGPAGRLRGASLRTGLTRRLDDESRAP
jgi:hypothetical protein